MLTAANHANYKDARSSRPLFRAASGNMFLLSGRASPTGVTLTVEEIQCVVAPKPAIFIPLPIQDYTTLFQSKLFLPFLQQIKIDPTATAHFNDDGPLLLVVG